MNSQFNLAVQAFAFASFLFGLAGCESVVTQMAVNNKNIQLDDTHTLKITKVDEQEKSIGGITKHVYSTTNRFRYSVMLSPEKAAWEEKGAEPKKILICDNDIYLSYLEKRVNELYVRQSEVKPESDLKKEPATEVPRYKLGRFHAKFVDQRYFFKLFGSSFWLDVPSGEYKLKAETCAEFDVPNDNEFKLDTAAQ